MKKEILLIEDDRDDLFFIRKYLENREQSNSKSLSFNLDTAADLQGGLQSLKNKEYHLILLDMILPDSFGLDTFTSIHNANPDIPVIILSGLNDEELAGNAIKQGAVDYLIKGEISEIELLNTIIKNLEQYRG